MKNAFDKVRDVLYDGMDYIIMLAIIVVIALIINWRLDGLFAIETADLDDKASVNTEESIVDDFVEENEKNEKENDDSEEEEETEDIISIDIPVGSLPGDIADILVSNGLIEDKSEFIDKVVELKLETQLRSGEYEIKKDATLEDILVTLTK